MSMPSVVCSSTISYTPLSGRGRAFFPSRSFSRPFLPLQNRVQSLRVKCSYSGTNIEENFRSTVDVTANVKTEKLVVLGGSGFIGSAICKAAVSNGIEVVSLSRSGRPRISESWVDQVSWFPGDVFYANWDEILVGATAVVSTVGGIGNEEQMKRINGEANVTAVNAAKEYGVPKFIFISVHDYNIPSFLLEFGYFTGKRKAEAEVLSRYPNSGVVLRPAVVYGKKRVDGFEIPLDVVGEPWEKILNATENLIRPLNSLPASDLLLAPPVSVDDLALAVINAVRNDDMFGIFTIDQLSKLQKCEGVTVLVGAFACIIGVAIYRLNNSLKMKPQACLYTLLVYSCSIP